MTLVEHLRTLAEAHKHPVRQWEDDEFATLLFRAEQEIDAVNLFDTKGNLRVSIEMVDLLLARDSLQKTDADTWTVGPFENSRINQEIEAVNMQLRALAETSELTTDVRELLNIPAVE